MSRVRGYASAMLWVLMSSTPAVAQRATLSGTVVDRSGGGVTGALVTTTADPVRTTLTDANGGFVLPAGALQPVEVVIEKRPFRSARVNVEPGRPARVVLDLAGADESVVVASPLVEAASFDRFGASRTVVSSDQIESLNAVDLAAALRRVPGVTISRFNPVGSFGGAEGGAVFVRGTGASRPGSEIKAYIDGAPFYMGTWGHPLLDLLPVTAMEDVSVLKGPHPQTFGNAFSAIDMRTLRSLRDGTEALVRVSGGAFGTLVEQADVSGGFGPWEFVAAQGFARSDGHRDEADGRLANGFGRVGYRFDEHWSIGGLAMLVNNRASDPGRIDQPATRAGTYETEGTLASVTLAHQHDSASGTVQVYANRGEGNWFDQLGSEGDTLTTFAMTGLRWRETLPLWRGGVVSAGLDVDRVDGDVVFERVAPAPQGAFAGEAMHIVAPHVAVEHAFVVTPTWAISPSAGVRHYVHSELDSETAPHVGVVARHASGLAMRVSYARGVNYPGQEVAALSALIPPLGQTWRDLHAETMDHVEVGVTFAPTRSTTVDASYFDDHLDNRYVFGFPPALPRPSFVNLGSYTVRGGEVSVQQGFGRAWEAFVGLTVLDPSLATLPYAPEASLVLGLNGLVGRFRISVDAQSQSSMFVLAQGRAAAGNTERVDGFTVVNLRPAYQLPALGRRGEIFLAVENLFDADYEYRPGYPMPGVSVQVGVTLGWRR